MARSDVSEDEHMSDYTDAEAGEVQQQMVIPARPAKKGVNKRKAGGFGKKGKVFASMDKMLAFADAVNDEQDKKLSLLVERDIEVSKRLAQREASKKRHQETKKQRLEEVKDDLKAGNEGRPGKKGGNEGRPGKKSSERAPMRGKGHKGQSSHAGKPSSGKKSFSKDKPSKGPMKKGGPKKKVSFK